MKIVRKLYVKVVCVFEQALHAKVNDIFSKDEKMRRIIVEMCAF